jgi:hypothetical protein
MPGIKSRGPSRIAERQAVWNRRREGERQRRKAAEADLMHAKPGRGPAVNPEVSHP